MCCAFCSLRDVTWAWRAEHCKNEHAVAVAWEPRLPGEGQGAEEEEKLPKLYVSTSRRPADPEHFISSPLSPNSPLHLLFPSKATCLVPN